MMDEWDYAALSHSIDTFVCAFTQPHALSPLGSARALADSARALSAHVTRKKNRAPPIAEASPHVTRKKSRAPPISEARIENDAENKDKTRYQRRVLDRVLAGGAFHMPPKRRSLVPSLREKNLETERRAIVLLMKSYAAQRSWRLHNNLAHVRNAGLPPLDFTATSATLPRWLTDALQSLELHARVIDYWPADGMSSWLVEYLRRVGFVVNYDARWLQEVDACPYVAARAVCDLHAAGSVWSVVDVSRAADHEWVFAGNLALGRRVAEWHHGAFLNNADVETLVRGFHQRDNGADDVHDWLPRPCAIAMDEFFKVLTTDLQQAVGGAVLPLRLRVVNTDRNGQAGRHWFTVAYTVGMPARGATRRVRVGAGRKK